MYLKDRYDWQFARLKFCSIIQSFMINFATASIHCNIWDPGNITATEFRELMSRLNKKHKVQFVRFTFKNCVNMSSFFFFISSSANLFCSIYRSLSSSVIFASFFLPDFFFLGGIFPPEYVENKKNDTDPDSNGWPQKSDHRCLATGMYIIYGILEHT